MNLADIPREWRAPAALVAFAVTILGIAWTAEARIDSKIQMAAADAVKSQWSETYEAAALKACTSAADQGAYRAVSEAMQQTVIPMQRSIDAHLAAQAEHERNDERRFGQIERRLGIR